MDPSKTIIWGFLFPFSVENIFGTLNLREVYCSLQTLHTTVFYRGQSLF